MQISSAQYRFVTPHRCGKWYPDLGQAQQQAARIGAGFRDPSSGAFQAYLGTKLEEKV